MTKNTIKIIPFSEENALFIKALNVEWLEKYFYVEPSDILMLSNPKEEIIDKGGKIFYAKYNNQIVGTFSLLKIDEITFELSKMAVSEKFHGIGFRKCDDVILFSFCKRQWYKKVDFIFEHHFNSCNKIVQKTWLY